MTWGVAQQQNVCLACKALDSIPSTKTPEKTLPCAGNINLLNFKKSYIM
jgi:hypothetical protein